MTLRTSHFRRGNALTMALLFAVILTAIAGSGLRVLQQKYRLVHQAASWQEALLSSEAGVDLAVNEMRASLVDPDAAWQGWITGEDGALVDPTNSTIYFTSTVLLRSGEGGQRSWAEVAVDAPEHLQDGTGEQWYRIRSMGVSEVPGGSIAVGQKADHMLRKLDLFFNRRTGNRVLTPQATRLVEAIVKPVGTFRLALFGISTINLNNHNIVVDSYDSRYDTKSTNGVYDINKRQENGNIATNGTLISAGNAHIYGSAATNGGTVLGAENVSGEVREDFYQEVLPVKRPDILPDAGTPTQVINDANNATFVAQPDAPSQYLLSRIKIEGLQVLRIQGASDGSDTYCQIVVTGDVSLAGNAKIVVDPGVHVRLFVVGNTDIGGLGVVNPNRPTHFQLYGVDRPKNADGTMTPGLIKIAGNGGFRGAVYAPEHNIELKGGGTSDSIFGSFVGNLVSMNGIQAVHYDEALADGGLISDYKVVSWFEDVR